MPATVSITCDDCAATLTGEAHKNFHGPEALTIDLPCGCGSKRQWSSGRT